MSFLVFLRDLEESLDIPYPARHEVLVEIRSHLEALHEDLIADGVPPEEATACAIEALRPENDFYSSMNDVHRTAVARALARLPRSISLGIEFGAIGGIGLVLLFTIIYEEATMIEFMLSGGFFMIPINLAGIAILFLGIERVYSLFIKRDHSTLNLKRRLLSLDFLAIACALTGTVGTLVGFYQAFTAAPQIMQRFAGEFPIYEVARIALTTTIWGMTLALVAVIFRFIAAAKIHKIESQRLS